METIEAIIDLLQEYSLSILEVFVLLIPVFFIGYLIGRKKSRKLTEEVYGLQRQVLDLNEELLTGSNGSETPVIEIKHESLKIGNIAK